MTGPSPRDVQSVEWARPAQLTDETLYRVAVFVASVLFTRPAAARVAPLYDMLSDIGKASRPAPDQPPDPGAALGLARRMGELQAQTLAVSAPPAITQAAVTATQQAGFNTPLSELAAEGMP